MQKWEFFEKSCAEYLEKSYSNNSLHFGWVGKSNSTKPDIAVIKNSYHVFYIEAKMPTAQSGQFVLTNTGWSFIFSTANKSQENEFTKLIINQINSNYDHYKDVSTATTDINLNSSIYAAWIIYYYKEKGVKYIITADSKSNYIIFPIECFEKYFNISATLRIKNSGSSNLPQSRVNTVKELFSAAYGACQISYKDCKAYLITSRQLPIQLKLHSEDCDYQLKNVDTDCYIVTKLSKTRNPNVIFSITLINEQDDVDLDDFLNQIG